MGRLDHVGAITPGMDYDALEPKLLGKRIRALRKAHGHTQESLAAEIRVDPTTISNWERGVRTADVEAVVRGLGVTIEEITDGIPQIASIAPVLDPTAVARWCARFERMAGAGQISDLLSVLDLLYGSAGDRPLHPDIHELTSRLLLEQRRFEPALREADRARQFAPLDPRLLHQEALCLVELGRLSDARERLGQLPPTTRKNPEIAGLHARISTTLSHQASSPEEATALLGAARDACRASFRAHPGNYYVGGRAAVLTTELGEPDAELVDQVLDACTQEGSFWAHFTRSEMLLLSGEPDEARVAYAQALECTPAPTPRQQESARRGVRRAAAAVALTPMWIDDEPSIDEAAWRPAPAAAAELPKELLPLVEALSERAHDAWAQQRFDDGWRLGPTRDDAKKEHPNLVPYEALSEPDKDYDRVMIRRTLGELVALGYTVAKSSE